MKDQDLLKALVDAGVLSRELADKLAQEAQAAKRSAEQLIYERRLADEAEVVKVKAKLLAIPFKKVNPDDVTPDLLQLIPLETTSTYKIIPLARSADTLIVGALNPDDLNVKEAIRFIGKELKLNVGVYLVTPSDINTVLKKHSGFKDEVQAALKAVAPKKGTASRAIKLETEVAVAEESPVIKIVTAMLKDAVSGNASDVHIEPQRDRLRVRFRLDGVLQETSALPIELQQPIISRVKILSNLKIDETRIPQDGRFRALLLDREIDFRVSTFPTPHGEKIAIRVLDPSVGLRSLEDIGLWERNAKLLKEAIAKPYGMILITGPTGSGKTTTLYSLMQILNKDSVNIVSLEDPVEYSISGVNQSQIRPEIGYDFGSGLREILRQDPDVIMVGEVRDKETASLGVHAALTGHIVLTTLHTNNAVTAIPRLIDLDVQPFLLPSALNIMAAQRLVGELCPNCKKAVTPPPPILSVIKKEIEKLPADARGKYKEPYKIWQAPGCSVCKNKGTIGRLAIFEAFKMTPELAEIINTGITENKLWQEARRQGMVTLRQDAIMKALDGRISMEEVLRETEEC
jgi:type IV pilus assembly protein PilB